MEKILKDISKHKKIGHQANKKRWYKLGRYLDKGNKLQKHPESLLVARRTYKYYKVNKGDWEGPTPRKLSKIPEYKFNKILRKREETERGILLTADLSVDRKSRDETCEEEVVQEVPPQQTTDDQRQTAESFLRAEDWDWWDLQGATPEGCGI
jgi:hypothetical protein